MSTAVDKNAQALQALFGSASLADRLGTTRIAVVTSDAVLQLSGHLLAKTLADVLARLWPNIDFSGFGAEEHLATALSAASSGGCSGDGLMVRWAPPYDMVISLGCDAQPDSGHSLRVGANGWVAELGSEAVCGESDNPVGPAFVAAMAAAQVFYTVFEVELSGRGAIVLEDCCIDVRELFDATNLEVAALDFGETHVFGVGAVTHGLVHLLESWPENVSGKLHLVDQDTYGNTNGQRYAFMRSENANRLKVDEIASRLKIAHHNLAVIAHPKDLNTYCAERGYDEPFLRVIAGLDSAEARRQVALKLPERAVNMWTEGVRVGAGRYMSTTGSACLACDYLEKVDVSFDEVALLHQQTGLRPDVVRTLLDGSHGLSQDEASIIASRWSVTPDQFVGQPLRSVMPVLCATGRLDFQSNSEAVDVPFAFASLFAGIAGFMMLLKDLKIGNAPSQGWTQHVFKKPSVHMHRLLHQRVECVCCNEQT